MYADLKNIFETIKDACSAIKRVKATATRRRIGTDLIEAQLHCTKVHEVGQRLLAIASAAPGARLSDVPEAERMARLQEVHGLLADQQRRLHRLNELLRGKEFLDVFGEGVHAKIEEQIGTKEDGMFGIAAAIEFYFIFGPPLREHEAKEKGKEVALLEYQGDLIHLILDGGNRATIDLELARQNLTDLQSSATKLRAVLSEHFTFDECAAFSDEVAKRLAAPATK